jgi:hypothetical protein
MKMRHRIEFHKFSRDQTTQKLEIAQLFLNAPIGSSIFQTPSEINDSNLNRAKIEDKYRSVIENLKGKMHKPNAS